MICRGPKADNLLLVLLVLATHQAEFQQIGFNKMLLLVVVVVGVTWASRAGQRSMENRSTWKDPCPEQIAGILVASKSFQYRQCIRRIAAQSPRARWDSQVQGQVPARSASCRGGADRHDSYMRTRVSKTMELDCAIAAVERTKANVRMQRKRDVWGRPVLACCSGYIVRLRLRPRWAAARYCVC